ncbi:MAG: diadenylate cyclase [Geodermatophilaceae bacterium]
MRGVARAAQPRRRRLGFTHALVPPESGGPLDAAGCGDPVADLAAAVRAAWLTDRRAGPAPALTDAELTGAEPSAAPSRRTRPRRAVGLALLQPPERRGALRGHPVRRVKLRCDRCSAQIAPGTPLRDGLERILRGNTGALVVLGQDKIVEAICTGGFPLDVEFSATRLRELAKMDGAVDPVRRRPTASCMAAVHLMPDPTIPTERVRHPAPHRGAGGDRRPGSPSSR